MEKHSSLKRLQTTLTQQESALRELEKERSSLVGKITTCRNLIEDTRKKIKLTSQTALTVTEHAILRYLERVQCLDLKEIVKTILPEKVEKQAMTLGDGKYPVTEEFAIMVKNNMVVSVSLPKASKQD